MRSGHSGVAATTSSSGAMSNIRAIFSDVAASATGSGRASGPRCGARVGWPIPKPRLADLDRGTAAHAQSHGGAECTVVFVEAPGHVPARAPREDADGPGLVTDAKSHRALLVEHRVAVAIARLGDARQVVDAALALQ